MQQRFPSWGLPLFLIIVSLVRAGNAWLLPPLQDEAYYFYWSRFLDWGYFDHPPVVAWLGSLGLLSPSSIFLARAGTLLLSLLSFPVLLSLFREFGLRGRTKLFLGLALSSANLGGILLGYITTPDIPMLFCWIVALHEAAVALNRNPKRWLSAGFFTGLGILGKYTMVLIGPVFLCGLLANWRELRRPWPYLGGAIAVLTILPHLLWLSQHEWITLRFQFGRGLKSEYGVAMESGSNLPLAQVAELVSRESVMAHYFTLPDDERPRPPKPPAPAWQRYLQGLGDFLSGQIVVWGALLIPIANGLKRRKEQQAAWPNPALKALAWSACLVPLIVFGLLSPFQHVEANWGAMYLIGASILLLQTLPLQSKFVAAAAGFNLILSLILTLHTIHPLQDKAPHRDRLLKETRGYEALARSLTKLDAPVFADTYQNVAEIAFYQPNLTIQQWPGISRTSELLRRPEMNPLQRSTVGTKFYLITDNLIPPVIPGARIRDLREILDCLEGELLETSYQPEIPYRRPCRKRVHRWLLAQYSLEADY